MARVSASSPEVAVGYRVVVPYRAWSAEAVRNASAVPSRKSAPPPVGVQVDEARGEVTPPRVDGRVEGRLSPVTPVMTPSSK
jgi:hypothetical protein